MPLASLIMALIQAAPQAITEVTALYSAVKSDISATDQVQIDAALAAAIQSDADATAAADAALTTAEQN